MVDHIQKENVKPGNIYAAHKLEMEKRVLDILPSAVMLRAEWMYDYYAKKIQLFDDDIKCNSYTR